MRVDDVAVQPGQQQRVDLSLNSGQATGGRGRGPAVPAERIVGRQFLIGSASEKQGYGLYSYLLFGGQPPKTVEDRFLALISEYLRLTEISQLSSAVPLGQQNITYLPLTRQPSKNESPSVFALYNYARSQELLLNVPHGPHTAGPYIVSVEKPLSKTGMVSSRYLYQDLSLVPANIVVLWVQEFIRQSSQGEFWRARDGARAALYLRTAIATLAAGVDPVKKSLDDWKGILASLIAWHPQEALGVLCFGRALF